MKTFFMFIYENENGNLLRCDFDVFCFSLTAIFASTTIVMYILLINNLTLDNTDPKIVD